MFAKLLIVSAIAAAALAVQYPAGLHPAVCPNYPLCDVEVLARYTPQGVPIPEWELPYAGLPYAGFPYARMIAPYPIIARAPARIAAPTVAPVEAPIDAPVARVAPVEPARYPADFDASLCPNYPTCE